MTARLARMGTVLMGSTPTRVPVTVDIQDNFVTMVSISKYNVLDIMRDSEGSEYHYIGDQQ